MTNIKHLTNNQLLAYHDGLLDEHEKHSVGKHLLKCPECRKRLPLPSVEKFISAILDVDNTEDSTTDEKSNLITSLFAVSSFLNLNKGFVLGSAALVLLFSLTFVVWLSIDKETDDVARNFELNSDSSLEINLPAPSKLPSINIETPSKSSNQGIVRFNSKDKKRVLQKPEIPIVNKANPDINLKNPKRMGGIISSTRGVSAKCIENRNLEYEFAGEKDNFVFKWKKVSGAMKYHLYISDDNEILIDEYETTDQTTFVLKKQLDPLKTYQWKIIITLENGQTVVGPSSKFTIKDFQQKINKPEKKEKSEIRCSAIG